jgi:hypothetical protein
MAIPGASAEMSLTSQRTPQRGHSSEGPPKAAQVVPALWVLRLYPCASAANGGVIYCYYWVNSSGNLGIADTLSLLKPVFGLSGDPSR